MSNSKYALAMYDVRGKQEYIFKTNKLKEIVGGSCIIRDCFKEYLFPSAEEYMRRKAKKEGYHYLMMKSVGFITIMI